MTNTILYSDYPSGWVQNWEVKVMDVVSTPLFSHTRTTIYPDKTLKVANPQVGSIAYLRCNGYGSGAKSMVVVTDVSYTKTGKNAGFARKVFVRSVLEIREVKGVREVVVLMSEIPRELKFSSIQGVWCNDILSSLVWDIIGPSDPGFHK